MKTTKTMMGWLLVMMLALGAGSAFAKKPAVKKEYSGVVNLNTGTAQQLDQLPGIGEKAALRILEYRKKTPFAKIEDLRKVKGFGAKKFEKLKPYLTVSGPSTLAVRKVKNDAPPAEPSAQGRKAPTPQKR